MAQINVLLKLKQSLFTFLMWLLEISLFMWVTILTLLLVSRARLRPTVKSGWGKLGVNFRKMLPTVSSKTNWFILRTVRSFIHSASVFLMSKGWWTVVLPTSLLALFAERGDTHECAFPTFHQIAQLIINTDLFNVWLFQRGSTLCGASFRSCSSFWDRFPKLLLQSKY